MYLVSNDTILAISKSNKYETRRQKITTLLTNERHVLVGSYFYTHDIHLLGSIIWYKILFHSLWLIRIGLGVFLFYFIFCLCLACVCFRLLFGLKLLLVNFVVGLVKFILEFRTIKFFIAFKKINNIVEGSNCKFIETNC